ncbi:uracil-DNA glycosylase [Malassezia brasiliensis]|uniref:Uracil-DNA glycosylase n=1 Tax=Malassezia brasiliensis TaxID=1821822 RepID=A0AAF0DRY7_9BASI|nr:uracil-DNA glycosylase [Malassezia brasiliensis]
MSITSPAAKRARTIHARDVAPSTGDEFDEFDVPEEDLLRAVESAEARPMERDMTRPVSSPPEKAPSSTERMPPTPPSSSPASSVPPVADRSIPPAPTYNLPYAGTPDDPLALERTTMNKEWFDRLEPSMRRDSFANLKQFLDGEKRAGKTIYPPPQLIHSWSRTTPLEKVKVVIIGQDPYHQPGQACGHSFSVPMGKAVPASLQNIYKELKAEYPDFVPPKHG